MEWDLKYIKKIEFEEDFRIIVETVKKAIIKQEGISQNNIVTAEDFGDYLLRTNKIDINQYQIKHKKAKMIMSGENMTEIEKIEDKYSVLMSLYKKENAENFKIAINSMLNQTLKPDEIVLVEDGVLTEQLYDVIKEIKDNYPGLITSVVHKKNQGLGLALQHGLEVARNEIIARMDTDDIAVPERCQLQLEFMNTHPDISIVGGQIEEFIGNINNVVGKRIVPTTDKLLKGYLKKRCPFNHMTVMFRKSDILEVGNYQEWFWNEDYYLWIRLAIANKKFANLPQTLVKMRTGPDMYKRRGGVKYFKSERDIQKLMLKNGMISYLRYFINVSERLVLQILMPNFLRGIVFRAFARKK